MFSIAPFRFDVTPPLGHALLGGLVPSATAIDDELEAMGYVLLGNEAPIVVCVLDWAGLMNASHLSFRRTLAEAARTSVERVALHCVHQHNAPFVCEETRVRLSRFSDLPPVFDPQFFDECRRRGAAAVRKTLRAPVRVTHVAHGRGRVVEVASNRRVDRADDGRVNTMRGSSCTDPGLIALPEGTIDPELQTVAYFSGERKVVACHYYATHPMSYYRDGRVTSDFCGLARKRRQAENPDCTHVYFTGCAGNVAAGKYNDGSPAARRALAGRIYDGMIASESALQLQSLDMVRWEPIEVRPTSRQPPSIETLGATVEGPAADRVGRILQAYWQSWQRRCDEQPGMSLSALHLNEIAVLHLPGEIFIEYQIAAQDMAGADPVAVAAYGDGGPWYVPLRDEYSKGGYETEVAFCEPVIEQQLRQTMRTLLGSEVPS